jgi:hypothetical protein
MNPFEQHAEKAKQLLLQQLTHQEVRLQLMNEGLDEQSLSEVMDEAIKKAARSKALNRGVKMIGVGALFLFLGFFCTICFNDTGFNEKISLYGFTSLGGVLLIGGMILVFG